MSDSLEEAIRKAKAGDKEAAEDLITRFRETVLEQRDSKGRPFKKPSGAGTEIDEPLLDYLAECFGVYLEKAKSGAKPVAGALDDAFGLRPKRGRPQDPHLHEDLARRIFAMRMNGRTWPEIIEEVTDPHGPQVDEADIRAAYRKHRAMLISEETSRRIDLKSLNSRMGSK